MSESTNIAHREWRQGYRLVIAALFGIGLGLSPLPYYTMIILSEPLMADFGWTTGQALNAPFFIMLGILVSSPVVGYLTDIYGARRTALISTLAMAIFMAMFSFMNGSIVTYYTIFFFMSVFGAGTLPVTFTRAINNNFDKSRGLALGVALMGTGFTGFIVPDLTQALIDNYGWRSTYLVLALLPLFIAFPIAFFWFRDPKEDAALSNKRKIDTSIIPGKHFKDVLKDWRIYVIGFAFLAIGASISGIIPSIKFILQDQGYTPQMSASKFIGIGLIGLSVLIGRGVGGYLVDKFWAPGVAFALLVLPAVSCFIFFQGENPIWLNAIAIAFIGIAAGVEYDLMAFLISRYFGMKAYGRVYALLYAMFAIGAGLAPGMFGSLRDRAGTYDSVLILAGTFVVIGAVTLLTIGKYRNFDADGREVNS